MSSKWGGSGVDSFSREGRGGCSGGLHGLLLKWGEGRWRSTVKGRGGTLGLLVSTLEVGVGEVVVKGFSVRYPPL